jgi:hypothetical protein
VKINKVTIELKKMNAADKEAATKASEQLVKALADED